MNDAEAFASYSGALASLINFEATYSEALAMCYWGQQSSSTQGSRQTISNNGSGQDGVDYVFDGKKLSDIGEANGLSENRIVKKNKKGVIQSSININNTRIKKSDFKAGKGEVFTFFDDTEMAIQIWGFLALNSNNEWSITEFKLREAKQLLVELQLHIARQEKQSEMQSLGIMSLIQLWSFNIGEVFIATVTVSAVYLHPKW